MTLEISPNENTYAKQVSPFYQERIDGSFKSPQETQVVLIPKFNDGKIKRDELVACIKSRREWEYWIAKFDSEELSSLKEQFDSIAKNNIISQNSLFDFMGKFIS